MTGCYGVAGLQNTQLRELVGIYFAVPLKKLYLLPLEY